MERVKRWEEVTGQVLAEGASRKQQKPCPASKKQQDPIPSSIHRPTNAFDEDDETTIDGSDGWESDSDLDEEGKKLDNKFSYNIAELFPRSFNSSSFIFP